MILPLKYEYAKILNSRYPMEYFTGFSQETRNIIRSLLNFILDGEKLTEQRRKMLASYRGFSSYECFEMMKNRFATAIFKDDVRKNN